MRLVVPVFHAAVTGRRPPGGESVSAPEVAPRDAVRQVLEGIVESGQGGSEIGAVMTELDKLAAEDAALAEELKADAESMMTTMESGKIKAKAKEMLDKLGGGAAPSSE